LYRRISPLVVQGTAATVSPSARRGVLGSISASAIGQLASRAGE
jgi:hypothetical protein